MGLLCTLVQPGCGPPVEVPGGVQRGHSLLGHGVGDHLGWETVPIKVAGAMGPGRAMLAGGGRWAASIYHPSIKLSKPKKEGETENSDTA